MNVVLVDIDGVLLNSANAVLTSYRIAFNVKGHDLPDHVFYEDIWGNNWSIACLCLKKRYGLLDWNSIHHLKQRAYFDLLNTGSSDIMQHNDLICSVLELLFNRSDVEVRLVTGMSQSSAIATMQWLEKIRVRTGWSVLSISAGLDKRHSDTWRSLFSRLKPKSLQSDCYVIEDDLRVVQVLRSFGCQTVYIPAFGHAKVSSYKEKELT